MPIDFDFASVDTDLLRMAREAKTTSNNASYRPIYQLNGKQNTYTGWFVTNPWESNNVDWYQFRQGSAFNGFHNGIDAPPGNLKTFPAIDEQVTIQNGVPKIVRQKDELVTMSIPGKFDTDYDGNPMTHAKVSPHWLINFVTDEGKHILLDLSSAKGRDLREYFLSIRSAMLDEGAAFTILNTQWTVSLIGDSPYEIKAVRVKGSEATDLPEPINCQEMARAWRQEIEEWWAEANGDSFFDEDSVVEDEIVDDFEESFATMTESPIDASFFEGMSKARLKGIIAKAETAGLVPAGSIPQGAQPAQLIDIIVRNGLSV